MSERKGSHMQKKLSLILAIMLVIAMAMSGCSNTTESQEKEKFQEYYDSRVQRVGDNSKVSELLNVLDVGDLGEYTITLKTDKAPYGLTVNYSALREAGDETKLENGDRIDFAYYALALIENLNEIDVNYKDYNYHLSREQANKIIGGDIQDFGNNIEKLKELNNILNSSD